MGVLGAVRVSIWTGFAILVLALLGLNLAVPLHGSTAVIAMVALTVLLAAVGVALVLRARRNRAEAVDPHAPFEWWVLVPIVALAAMLVVMAHAAFGSVSNFDSGLYHLNSISFAAEYRTIPGLGNLHDRYGTNVSVFNVAAFMTNLPWGADAFRLMVGFVISLFAVDLSLRLADAPRRRSPGLYVMALAAMLFAPFLMSDTGYWVTSPAADTTAMLVSIVSAAFLVDALSGSETVNGSLAVLTAALAASMRAQLWVLFGLTVVVLVAVAWRRRRRAAEPRGRVRALTWVGAGLSVGLLAVQLVRDVVLSGWLLYPAGNFPVPVEWRTGDPQVAREWIQSWARTPGADPSTTQASWDWFGPWLGRNLDDWAVRGAIGLLALALLLVLARRAVGLEPGSAAAPLRLAALAVIPAIGTTLVWFLAAPDPRFAWGAIASVGLVPAAVLLMALPAQAVIVPVVAGLMSVFVLPAAVAGIANVGTTFAEDWESRTYSFGPIDVVAAVNPVPVPAVEDVILDSGDVVQHPVGTDQCWTVFPLCRPTTETSLRFRGAGPGDGFVTGS